MKRTHLLVWMLIGGLCASSAVQAAASSHYKEGVDLYKEGRMTEATAALNKAIQKKDHVQDAQKLLERIRRETVERIRNKALVGETKLNWKNKFFYVRSMEGNIQAGLSAGEIFEKNSLNFRREAVDALMDLADILRRSDNSTVDIDLINEHPQDEETLNSELVAQQVAAVFSFLSLATHDQLPR